LQAGQVIVLADFVVLNMMVIYSERSLFVKREMRKIQGKLLESGKRALP
jgi:hypothetical protein